MLKVKQSALSILISLALFLPAIQVDCLAEDRVAVFNDFSGGLNVRKNIFNLNPNQADIVQNIRFDNEVGTISKRDKTVVYGTADATESITGMHRLYLDDGTKKLIVTHGDEIEVGDDTTGTFSSIYTLATGDRRWQWLTWKNIAIGTDGSNYPVKYNGTDITNLGSAFAEDAGDGAGPDGTYTYKINCYSASYDATFDVPSNSVTVSDNDIDLSMIPLCPDTILGEDTTGREVYRNTVAAQTTWRLLTNGQIADNTTTTLTDSDADAAIAGRDAYPTGDEVLTPPKGKYILVHNSRLWMANSDLGNSYAEYSLLNNPDAFYDDNYVSVRLSDGDEITGIKTVLGKLTVWKTNTVQKIYTDNSDDTLWSLSDPFSFIGCHAPYSIVNTQLGAFYLGNNGIYLFNGQYSQLLSDSVTPIMQDISPSNYSNVWAEFYNNTYYMTYTSEESGASYNNRILTYNIIEKAYNIDTLSTNVFHVFRSGTDIEALYSGDSDDGQVRAHANTLKQIVHRNHSDFTGTFDDARYIPTAFGGDETETEIEIAWTENIDDIASTMDSVSGIIDRPDTTGQYISQYLTVNASQFDKLFWNETIPTSGGDVQFYIRAGSSTSDCAAQSWFGPYTDSSGSDISTYTADTVMQYRFDLSTDNIVYTPTVYFDNNYTVKVTYSIAGATDETEIPLIYRTGWIDLANGYNVELKKFYIYYDKDADNTDDLTVTFENYWGDTDVFTIDLNTYPDSYIEYFTTGKFLADKFRIKIEENSVEQIQIKEIILVYSVNPLV